MTCPKLGCHALLLRVERCQEFKTVRYRWVCASGHSGFLADDLPEYGQSVEPVSYRPYSYTAKRHSGGRMCTTLRPCATEREERVSTVNESPSVLLTHTHTHT